MLRDGEEIGQADMPVRRKRTRMDTTSTFPSPASALIDQDESSDREQRAMRTMTPNRSLPVAPPIGPAKRRGRPRKADRVLTPIQLTPSVATFDQDESSDREQRANASATPTPHAPAAQPIGHDTNVVAGGDGQSCHDTHCQNAISALIDDLIGAQKLRRFAITEKNRSERAIESLLAGFMGIDLDASEKERKAVYARVKAFRLAIENGTANPEPSNTMLMVTAPTILASRANRQQWLDLHKNAEKDLKRLAKHLPVYEFAQSVRGFGDLGLAVLTAEAGMPMGDYPTVSKLWKRMGLAVMGDKEQYVADGDRWKRIGKPALNDKRQQKCRDETEASIHGYVPRRRAEVWAFCSDSMFRVQWRGARDEDGNNPTKTGKPEVEPAGPNGTYGEIYARRRAHTAPRIAETEHLSNKDRDKWTAGRCHNDARRIMSKALLRDLWRVWRGMPPHGSALDE